MKNLLLLFVTTLLLLVSTSFAIAPWKQLQQTLSSSSFLQVTNPQKQTWQEWRRVRDENHSQKFGFEIEIKKTYVSLEEDQEFAKWYYKNNHHAAYQGKGAWSNLEIHLDDNSALGNGTLLELVSKPLTVASISTLLEQLRATLKPTMKKAALVAWLKENFDPVNDISIEENRKAYEYVERNMKLQNVGSASFFPRMMQITTTLTVPEMKRCSHEAVSKVWEAVGKPNSDADMIKYLNKLKYIGTKPNDFIVKHCAEQFMPEFAETKPPTIPEDGFAGNELEYKLHTLADKLAPLFKRNGNFAYVIEFRGAHPSNVEQSVSEWLRGSTGKDQLAPLFTKLTGCR